MKIKKDSSDTQVISPPKCDYSTESGQKKILIMDCKNCQENTSLKNGKCRAGILRALGEESNVEEIILSDYMEQAYSGDSIKILSKMLGIVENLDELALSKKMFLKNQENTQCNECPVNPQNIFLDLKKSLLVDIPLFYERLVEQSKRVQNSPSNNKVCYGCLNETKDDLVYIFNQCEDLRKEIFLHGFRIIM